MKESKIVDKLGQIQTLYFNKSCLLCNIILYTKTRANYSKSFEIYFKEGILIYKESKK